MRNTPVSQTQFYITVASRKSDGTLGPSWTETYFFEKEEIDHTLEAVQIWADETLAYFNRTLRVHELSRELQSVSMTGESKCLN